MPSAHGSLDWVPLRDRLDLVAAPVAAVADQLPHALVAPVDPALADTDAFCAAYDVSLAASANCIVVEARRGEVTTLAAVLVLGTDRADINRTVRKHLEARRISFASPSHVAEITGMESGGITPLGLPAGWPVLVDANVVAAGDVVIGGGLRSAKILTPAVDLAELPDAVVLGLAV